MTGPRTWWRQRRERRLRETRQVLVMAWIAAVLAGDDEAMKRFEQELGGGR
jgi:hypothetical protein